MRRQGGKASSRLMRDDDHRVTVRIWESNLSAGSIGHATLQTYGTNAIYASFWPYGDGRGDPKSICAKIARVAGSPIAPRGLNIGGLTGSLIPSHEVDEWLEGSDDLSTGNRILKAPDVVKELFSLDTAKIKAAFTAFEECVNGGTTNWAALPNLQSIFGHDETSNCSGLVSYLLKEGGITELIGNDDLVKTETIFILGGLMVGIIFVLLKDNKASAGKILRGAVVGAAGGAAVGYTSLVAADTAHGIGPVVITPSGIAYLVDKAQVAEEKLDEMSLLSLDLPAPVVTSTARHHHHRHHVKEESSTTRTTPSIGVVAPVETSTARHHRVGEERPTTTTSSSSTARAAPVPSGTAPEFLGRRTRHNVRAGTQTTTQSAVIADTERKDTDAPQRLCDIVFN